MDRRQQQSRREFRKGALRAIQAYASLERSEGTLLASTRAMVKHRAPVFARDFTYAQLLQWAAKRYGSQTCLEYGRQRFSFDAMNRASNRVARALREAGVEPGTGVALVLDNHPHFLHAFFAIQKLGAYAVPVNAALVGEGLRYILDHSQCRFAICDHVSAPHLQPVVAHVPALRRIWVNDVEAPPGFLLPQGMVSYSALSWPDDEDGNDVDVPVDATAPSLLLYTSGTTGMPKAVVTPYGNQRVKPIGLLANLVIRPDDKLYTCLPLYHANALLLSVMQALWVGVPLCLSKRFSASRFWQEVALSGATQFNTVGSMIPILLKTPPSPHDRNHRVRLVISAACPKDAWQRFEERFGVTLWEGYGAVDGGGVTIFNFGNAPIGSLGRPSKATKWRLIKDNGTEAALDEAGELQVYVGSNKHAHVPYWRNEQASNDKVKDGWLCTGDMMQRDAQGFLYFVGRNTDSMRRRGENVSAYEVEKAVDSHPDVLESAAFGVPSPLGEQDIMVSVVPVEGHTIDPAALRSFLVERLPRYAIPSYLDVVRTLPKTGTHRVIKAELKQRGVTDRTIHLDAEPEVRCA